MPYDPRKLGGLSSLLAGLNGGGGASAQDAALVQMLQQLYHG